MSYMTMLGAKKYMEEKMGSACDTKERKVTKAWLSGYYVGLHEGGKLTVEELNILTHWLDSESWRC